MTAKQVASKEIPSMAADMTLTAGTLREMRKKRRLAFTEEELLALDYAARLCDSSATLALKRYEQRRQKT